MFTCQGTFLNPEKYLVPLDLVWYLLDLLSHYDALSCNIFHLLVQKTFFLFSTQYLPV